MFTAKRMKEVLDKNKEGLGNKVDKWLENEVLPRWDGDVHEEDVPHWIGTADLTTLLNLRGFDVKSHPYLQHCVSISIPPQGE